MKKKQKVVASIEARMNSSRLPGKVLMEACNTPLLEIMVNRVKSSKLIDDIVIATSHNEKDDILVEFCKKIKVQCYRGSENDVLLRVLEAHEKMETDIIVELTGDCPLIDPFIIDETIKNYLFSNPQVEYSTSIQKYKRIIPDGMDVDVFSKYDLRNLEKSVFDDYVREHISPYFWQSGRYKCSFLEIDDKYLRNYFLRITLDTFEDYKLIKLVHESLSPMKHNYDLLDILNFFDQNPSLLPK